ncbi:MAG: hypothetical protein ACRDM7_09315 [Thermoleophilaceae bacterium]
MSHRRHPRQLGRRCRADVDLVVHQQVGGDVVQQRANVVERAARQYVAEDDHPEAPPLVARQVVEPGVIAQREPVRLVNRDADQLGPKPQLPKPRQQLRSGAEPDAVPGVAARHRQWQQREDVPIGRTTAEENAHAQRITDARKRHQAARPTPPSGRSPYSSEPSRWLAS